MRVCHTCSRREFGSPATSRFLSLIRAPPATVHDHVAPRRASPSSADAADSNFGLPAHDERERVHERWRLFLRVSFAHVYGELRFENLIVRHVLNEARAMSAKPLLAVNSVVCPMDEDAKRRPPNRFTTEQTEPAFAALACDVILNFLRNARSVAARPPKGLFPSLLRRSLATGAHRDKRPWTVLCDLKDRHVMLTSSPQ
jgi:hypothetical protein